MGGRPRAVGSGPGPTVMTASRSGPGAEVGCRRPVKPSRTADPRRRIYITRAHRRWTGGERMLERCRGVAVAAAICRFMTRESLRSFELSRHSRIHPRGWLIRHSRADGRREMTRRRLQLAASLSPPAGLRSRCRWFYLVAFCSIALVWPCVLVQGRQVPLTGGVLAGAGPAFECAPTGAVAVYVPRWPGDSAWVPRPTNFHNARSGATQAHKPTSSSLSDHPSPTLSSRGLIWWFHRGGGARVPARCRPEIPTPHTRPPLIQRPNRRRTPGRGARGQPSPPRTANRLTRAGPALGPVRGHDRGELPGHPV